MTINESITFDRSRTGSYQEPNLCPLCKRSIKPQKLAFSTFKDENDNWYLSFMYLCNSCFRSFVTLHKCDFVAPTAQTSAKYIANFLYTGPTKYTEQHFEETIEKLSPQFVKIFNQAAEAEATGLDEIAGLGYRKAVEFLTKDFCIHMHRDKADEIKAKQLGSCITSYIDSEQIRTLASRIAWLGNDEAHYIRKHTERDISDMKRFISALVHFIGMTLIVEDAASIPPA